MPAARAVKAQLHIASFGVKFGRVIAHNHVAGLVFRVDADAGITFLLGKMKMPPEAGDLFETAAQVGRLRLQFLHANTIRQGQGKPLLQAFAGGGADAVKVETG